MKITANASSRWPVKTRVGGIALAGLLLVLTGCASTDDAQQDRARGVVYGVADQVGEVTSFDYGGGIFNIASGFVRAKYSPRTAGLSRDEVMTWVTEYLVTEGVADSNWECSEQRYTDKTGAKKPSKECESLRPHEGGMFSEDANETTRQAYVEVGGYPHVQEVTIRIGMGNVKSDES